MDRLTCVSLSARNDVSHTKGREERKVVISVSSRTLRTSVCQYCFVNGFRGTAMPMYDYHCGDCGGFSALRPLAEYREPMACPRCSATAARVISAPSLACMTASNRTAWERNERSAHEPRRGSCSSGSCGHAHHQAKPGAAASVAAKPAPITKAPTRARPWMLGH